MNNSQSLSLSVKDDDSLKGNTNKPTVLEEDVYIDAIEKIIQREYFPDLPKWKDQYEYIEAKKKRDFAKMLEIRQKYMKNPPKGGFTSLETPNFSSTPKETPNKRKKSFDDDEEKDNSVVDTNLTLSQFLNKYTSEDNASYVELAKKELEHDRKRLWWKEHYEKQNKYLLDSSKQSAGVLTWPVKMNNSLMYLPESINKNVNTDKVILKENTRISPDILLSKPSTKKKEINTVVSTSLDVSPASVLLGLKKEQSNKKIDLDDLVSPSPTISPSSSPKVGGYSFVSTPQINPNDGSESPFITWGEIEGTPLILDSGLTPMHPTEGPQFKIHEETQKEKALKKLTQKSKSNKDSSVTGTPRIGSRTPRLGGSTPILSAEGRKLASRMLKKKYGDSIDPQLRASYNSPLINRPSGSRTPLVTPKSTPILTPKK